MVYFVGIINIILMSILMKNSSCISRNMTKIIKLYQFFKIRDQIGTKKELENQLDIF